MAEIHKDIVIKVPLIHDGIKAVKKLPAEGLKENVTLCFSATQALIAAKAGASYISPFVGRLDDIASDGMGFIQQIIQIYDNYGYETEVLVASVRSPMHVISAAMMGAEVATIPFSVIKHMFKHPLTDIGLDKFLDDWKNTEGLRKWQKRQIFMTYMLRMGLRLYHLPDSKCLFFTPQ